MSPRLRAIASYRRLCRWHTVKSAVDPGNSERHLTAATIAYYAMEAEISNPQNIDVRKQR